MKQKRTKKITFVSGFVLSRTVLLFTLLSLLFIGQARVGLSVPSSGWVYQTAEISQIWDDGTVHLLNGPSLKLPEKAISQREFFAEREIVVRRRQLSSPYYADDDWTKQVIAHLEEHVRSIRAYHKDGGRLALPKCCKRQDYLCLIAG